jgi:hypothetical protein
MLLHTDREAPAEFTFLMKQRARTQSPNPTEHCERDRVDQALSHLV